MKILVVATTPYPLFFRPILKEKVWGGRNLARLGKILPKDALIGESWELADLPETVAQGQSVIANGAWTGMTLREAIAQRPEAIMGTPTAPKGGFPLLIKFLDARENLSLQVHPNDAFVRRHPHAHPKSEAWVVLRAEPGAVIYKGLKPHVTRKNLARHIATGAVIDDLCSIEARVGDCHYLPSGTCHALGAGIVVAEIQTPSDTTFRVYDWGRSGRRLHVDEALESISFGLPPPPAPKPGRPVEVGGLRTTPLVKTDFFAIQRIEALADTSLPIVTSGMPVVWMVLAGGGRINTPDAEPVDVATGRTVLLPAELAGSVARLTESSVLLVVTLPSPIEGLLANETPPRSQKSPKSPDL